MNTTRLARIMAAALALAMAAILSSCGGSGDGTPTSSAGGAKSTATAAATSTPAALQVLGRDGYSEFPADMQTRLGQLTVDRQFGRIGDEATASVEILANSGWLCGGENQVPGGVSQLSISAPAGTEIVSYSPETLDREGATVAQDGQTVGWIAGPPSPKPANCANGDSSGSGSPDGYFDIHTTYSITFKVTRAARTSFYENGEPVPHPWSKTQAGIQNEQGTGVGNVPFLTLDDGEYARTLVVDGVPSPFDLSSLGDNNALDIVGKDWDPSGGPITISIDGRQLAELPASDGIDESYELQPTDDTCDTLLEVRQGNIARDVTLKIDCPAP